MSTEYTTNTPANWDPLLTTKQAAKMLCVSTAFLERDRWQGTSSEIGPLIPFVKVGGRAVRYQLSVLQHHVEKNARG